MPAPRCLRPAAIGLLDQGMVPINIRSFPRPAPDQTPSKYFFGTSVDASAAELPVSAHSSASCTDYEGSGGIMLSGMTAEIRGSGNRCAQCQMNTRHQSGSNAVLPCGGYGRRSLKTRRHLVRPSNKWGKVY